MNTHIKRKVVIGLTGIGLISTMSLSPAQALLKDPIHNIAGGGSNVHANNTCVQKVGDTAKVEFMVQHQPLVLSSGKNHASNTGYIAIPKAMKNVTIQLEAIGDNTAKDDPEEDTSFVKFDNPLDINIKEGSDMKEGDTSSLVLHRADLNEKDIKEKVDNFSMAKLEDDEAAEATGSSVIFETSVDSNPWYGNHNDDYDFYFFGNNNMTATFKVTGEVEASNKDTFVPVASSNIGWKSSSEDIAGSYNEGSQFLGVYKWAEVGALPPALPQDEKMIDTYKKKNNDDGLDISPRIAPTQEIPGDAKYSNIGTDIRPSQRGDVGEQYRNTFPVSGAQGDTNIYIGQIGHSGEDGADIAASHITLCDDNDSGNDDKETTTPKDKDKDKDTPTTSTTPKKEDDIKEDNNKVVDAPTQQPSNNGSINTSHNNQPSKPAFAGKDFTPAQRNRTGDFAGGISSSIEEGEEVDGIKADTGGSSIPTFFTKIRSLF